MNSVDPPLEGRPAEPLADALRQPDADRPVMPAPSPGPLIGGEPASWQVPRIHPEGWRFAAIPAGAALVAALVGSGPLFWIGVVLTLMVAMFFRDPERVTPAGEELLVAPADGLVIQLLEADVPRQLVGEDGLAPGRALRISIFLSVFDVHINRAPLAGTVRRQVYVPGLFLNADLDKASEDNERSYLVIEGLDGTRVGVTQIAGLIARRILSFVRPGVMVAAGQRFGLIRFGSRTDLWLPPGWEPVVLKGQRVVGGETVMARKRA